MILRKENYSLISFILLIITGTFFLSTIKMDFFPDNIFIELSLKNMHLSELYFSPQYLFFSILEYFGIKLLRSSLIFLILFFFINLCSLICIIKIKEKFFKKQNCTTLNSNNHLLFLSLSMPSVLLSIITPSAESLYTIISVFIMFRIMERNLNYLEICLLFTIFIYSFFLDNGNWLVLLFFLVIFFFIIIIKNKISINVSILIITCIGIILFIYGEQIILLFTDIFNPQKGKAIIDNIYQKQLNKIKLNNIFIRYLYFWSTLLGFINHLKDLVFYIVPILISLAIICLINLYQNWIKLKKYFLDPFIKTSIFMMLTFPFLIISILPTHAYAKYYLFLVPILLKLISKIIRQDRLIIYIYLISFTTILNTYFGTISLNI